MSYILEALKKLEEKRRLETTTYLPSGEYPDRQSRKGRFLWGYLFVVALLLNAGILLWWLHPWRIGKDVAPRPGNVARAEPLRRSQNVSVMAGISGPGERQSQPIGNAVMGPSAGHEDNAAAVPSQTSRPESDVPAGNTKIIGMSELPSSVRQRLPDLTISGHFYDGRPSVRVVTVGGKILHEGIAAAPGLTLERITPDGAVFSFEGYRFHKGVF